MRRRNFTSLAGRTRRSGIAALVGCCLALFTVIAMLIGASVPRAHADGGAPNIAYVVGTGSSGGDLAALDIAQRQETWHMPIGGDPRAVVLSVDSRFVFIARASAGDVAVVDAHAHTIVATIPVGQEPSALALDVGNTGDLFVANSGSDTVSVLDPQSRRVLATVPVGKQPAGIAVAGAGSGIANTSDSEVYVANSGSDTVTVLSASQHTPIATIPAPGGPQTVVIPAAGGIAYVGTHAGTILALSLADHKLLGTLLQLRGSATGLMDYDVVSGQVYVPDPAANVVDILRPASAGAGGAPANLPGEPARALPIAGGPAAVAITFDGAFGFIAQRDSGQVTMFDVAAHHTLATIAVGGNPRAIVTGAYPPILSQQAASFVGILLYVVIGVVLLAVIIFYLRYAQRMQSKQARSPIPPTPSGDAGGGDDEAGDAGGTQG